MLETDNSYNEMPFKLICMIKNHDREWRGRMPILNIIYSTPLTFGLCFSTQKQVLQAPVNELYNLEIINNNIQFCHSFWIGRRLIRKWIREETVSLSEDYLIFVWCSLLSYNNLLKYSTYHEQTIDGNLYEGKFL